MTAATFAWCNPSGVFASGPLEDVLARLGSDLPAPREPRRRRPAGTRPRVLHVATQLLRHRRRHPDAVQLAAARPGPRAPRLRHRPGGTRRPDKISRVLAGPDALTLLDDGRPRLLDRAARCAAGPRPRPGGAPRPPRRRRPGDRARAAAGRAPRGAPGQPRRPRFWLGVHVADRIVNLRTSGARLDVERRGIPEARNALLVRPLVMRDRRLSRSAARAELGLPPNALVVASAADTYKYGAAGGETLLDVLLPVMRAHPRPASTSPGPSRTVTGPCWPRRASAAPGDSCRTCTRCSRPPTSTSTPTRSPRSRPCSRRRGWTRPCSPCGRPTSGSVCWALTRPSSTTTSWSLDPTLAAQVDRLLADADVRHRVGASTRCGRTPFPRRRCVGRAGREDPGRSAGCRSCVGAPVSGAQHGTPRPAAAARDGQRRRPGAGRDAGRGVTAPVVAAPRRDRGPAAAQRPGASRPPPPAWCGEQDQERTGRRGSGAGVCVSRRIAPARPMSRKKQPAVYGTRTRRRRPALPRRPRPTRAAPARTGRGVRRRVGCVDRTGVALRLEGPAGAAGADETRHDQGEERQQAQEPRLDGHPEVGVVEDPVLGEERPEALATTGDPEMNSPAMS